MTPISTTREYPDEPDDDDEDDETVPCPHCRRAGVSRMPSAVPTAASTCRARTPRGRHPWWLVIGVLICLALVSRWIIPMVSDRRPRPASWRRDRPRVATMRVALVYDMDACRGPTGVTRHALAQLERLAHRPEVGLTVVSGRMTEPDGLAYWDVAGRPAAARAAGPDARRPAVVAAGALAAGRALVGGGRLGLLPGRVRRPDPPGAAGGDQPRRLQDVRQGRPRGAASGWPGPSARPT